jgi:hypothetical protein
MNLLKHSKVRNTAILFELLVRQIAADTMDNQDSPAIALLRKHFKEGTELYKELSLYRTLAEERFDSHQATRFLSAAVQSRKQLNETILRRSKYNLIRDIKNKLVFENFINARISNYKLNASIFKVFEYNISDAPAEITRCHGTIIEHVARKETLPVPVVESFTKEDPVIRKLASKIVVDRFNEKYSSLNTSQKELLREYVNSINNSPALLDTVKNQIPIIVENLNTLNDTIPSKVIKIKLQEVTNMVSGMVGLKAIQDKHILTMLRYYELIEQLKGVQNGK